MFTGFFTPSTLAYIATAVPLAGQAVQSMLITRIEKEIGDLPTKLTQVMKTCTQAAAKELKSDNVAMSKQISNIGNQLLDEATKVVESRRNVYILGIVRNILTTVAVIVMLVALPILLHPAIPFLAFLFIGASTAHAIVRLVRAQNAVKEQEESLNAGRAEINRAADAAATIVQKVSDNLSKANSGDESTVKVEEVGDE